ncbi:MAG: hypothetical protein ACK6CU_21155 [Deltaproteobacteria bacterium]
MRLFRQRNTTPAVSVQSEYRWGTVTDPASSSAGAWQRTTDAFRVDGTGFAVGVRGENPRTVLTQLAEEVRNDRQRLGGTTFSAGAPVPGTTVTNLGSTRLELAGDPRFDMESPYVARSRTCLFAAACDDSTYSGWTYPLHDHRPCVTSGPRGAALSSRWSSIGRASYAERVLMTLTERGAAGP